MSTSPDLVNDGSVGMLADDNTSPYLQTRSWADPKPGTATVDHGQTPFTLGAIVPPALAVAAPGPALGCVMCRQGNDLIPYIQVTSGPRPDSDVGAAILSGQLTSNSVALPRDGSGVGWALPPQPAKYQLTAQATGAD